MSLFVKNVSRDVSLRDLQKEFPESSRIIIENNFALVEFKSERDAREAKDRLNGKIIGGLAIKIVWSNNSEKYMHSGVSEGQDLKC